MIDMDNGKKILGVLPLLFGFFIMGFVDVVGVATNYVKHDFMLSDSVANLLPMMVFVWFVLCSIPTGLLMGRFGRRNVVLLSIVITAVAMLIPIVRYDYPCVLVAFALLGIGNTILQVSLNPMVAAVVSSRRVASVLTLGQFIKAVSSMLGPVIAGAVAAMYGDWKLIFVVYAVVSVVSMLWLLCGVKAENPSGSEQGAATMRSVIALCCNSRVVMLFFGIMCVVGLDVGLNVLIPQVLMVRTGMPLHEAGLGTSLYFLSRTVGALIGAFMLTRISSRSLLKWCMAVALVALVALMLAWDLYVIVALVIILGLMCANVFSILFSMALELEPAKNDEVSALMIMGVSGGAMIPPVMGLLSDLGGVTSGIPLLIGCVVYICLLSFLKGK